MADYEEQDDGINVNRKLSIYKHIKKKAANDAQLLMNRIALIQKEEERARKKIEQTKSRANEILHLRSETEKRVQAYANATGEAKQLQQVMLAKNREQEEESRKIRAQKFASLKSKRKEDVSEMLIEKKYMTQLMIQEQEKAIIEKQRKREAIKRMEEEQKARREREREEKERKMKEFYEKKLAEEAKEAKRAEKLVKQLEKKEREWIAKLRSAQEVQENAYEQLEGALHSQSHAIGGGGGGSHLSPHSSGSGRRHREAFSPGNDGGGRSPETAEDHPQRTAGHGHEGYGQGGHAESGELGEVTSSMMSSMDISDAGGESKGEGKGPEGPSASKSRAGPGTGTGGSGRTGSGKGRPSGGAGSISGRAGGTGSKTGATGGKKKLPPVAGRKVSR